MSSSLFTKLMQQFTEKSAATLTPVWSATTSAVCQAGKAVCNALPKTGTAGKIVQAVGLVGKVPALTKSGFQGTFNAVHNLTEHKLGPALLSGAEHVKDVGCKCEFTTRHWAAQQVVCYGRRMQAAPAEAAQVWRLLRSGELTFGQLGRGLWQGSILTALFFAPTAVLFGIASPASTAHSYLPHAHGGH